MQGARPLGLRWRIPCTERTAYPGVNPFGGTPMDANTLSSPVRRRPRVLAMYGYFPQALTGGWIACASMSLSLRAAFLCAG